MQAEQELLTQPQSIMLIPRHDVQVPLLQCESSPRDEAFPPPLSMVGVYMFPHLFGLPLEPVEARTIPATLVFWLSAVGTLLRMEQPEPYRAVWRPIQMITAAAAEFIRAHSLSSAVELVGTPTFPAPLSFRLPTTITLWENEQSKRAWRPIQVITARAAEFIRAHSLSSAVEEVFPILQEAYQDLERISIDLVSDPEVDDSQWLAVTLRLRGNTQEILESERKARRMLRDKLRSEDYRHFVLSYELPA